MIEPIFLASFDLLAVLQAAFLFCLLLFPLVIIHEFGHYITAKMFKIKVLEFALGFPPRARVLWRGPETEYTFNWLPLGGYVRLLGEEDPTDKRSLAAAAPWKRLVVLYAGVVMNVAAAILLFSIGFMIPRERPLTMAQISDVAAGSPAAEAQIIGEMRDGSVPLQGLQLGDIVLEAEGREIRNTSELVFVNRLNLGKTQTWIINRQGSTLTARIYARFDPPPGEGPTGIRISAPATCAGVDDEGLPINCELLYPFSENQWFWPWEALPRGAQSLWDTVILTKNELQVRFSGSNSGGAPGGEDAPVFSGPVGIADTTSRLFDELGWRPLIELAALLSLSLAVFNVLPIPALDGGRAIFVIIELVRGGRRISPEREGLVHLVGMAVLLSCVVVITYFDLARILSQ